MRLDPVLSFEDWQRLGSRLAVHLSASAWWLGDWLVFGQYKYGRRYKMGVELTGLDYQTLRNYAAVARRFEPRRRHAALSFQHHAEVCGLDDSEQDEWLAKAEANGWSRNALRQALRSASNTRMSSVTVVRLSVDGNRRLQWDAAASANACSLEDWIVETLDEAARAHLDSSEVAPALGDALLERARGNRRNTRPLSSSPIPQTA